MKLVFIWKSSKYEYYLFILFSSSDAGDYRTNIVYSSPTIKTGDLIDMTNSGELRDIYVDVYWGDKQGNVFQLKLGANKQVNLRLCFIRR